MPELRFAVVEHDDDARGVVEEELGVFLEVHLFGILSAMHPELQCLHLISLAIRHLVIDLGDPGFEYIFQQQILLPPLQPLP